MSTTNTAAASDARDRQAFYLDAMGDKKNHGALALELAFLRSKVDSLAAPAQPVPAPGAPTDAPHAELRKTWREGQRWQTRGDPEWEWLDTTPCWWPGQEYRRHPDDFDAAAPVQALDALKKAGAIAVSAAKTNSRDIADWREDMDRIAAIAAQEGGQ